MKAGTRREYVIYTGAIQKGLGGCELSVWLGRNEHSISHEFSRHGRCLLPSNRQWPCIPGPFTACPQIGHQPINYLLSVKARDSHLHAPFPINHPWRLGYGLDEFGLKLTPKGCSPEHSIALLQRQLPHHLHASPSLISSLRLFSLLSSVPRHLHRLGYFFPPLHLVVVFFCRDLRLHVCGDHHTPPILPLLLPHCLLHHFVCNFHCVCKFRLPFCHRHCHTHSLVTSLMSKHVSLNDVFLPPIRGPTPNHPHLVFQFLVTIIRASDRILDPGTHLTHKRLRLREKAPRGGTIFIAGNRHACVCLEKRDTVSAHAAGNGVGYGGWAAVWVDEGRQFSPAGTAET
eukprot:comp22551_c1_seq1/m.34305 comp22551_c1_seq1/g.34305  ORF comp22551_c1_seq1/g.34305 comp22551_c1_seq1/m.34305 type:complete len:344 (+) comp22551_c1_seq1:1277-2308(+)